MRTGTPDQSTPCAGSGAKILFRTFVVQGGGADLCQVVPSSGVHSVRFGARPCEVGITKALARKAMRDCAKWCKGLCRIMSPQL
jgi:hypothetical protein